MNLLPILFIAILTTIIGALPFGLVNLTVLDVAHNSGKKVAMNLAHGAAWTEILFGLTAMYLAGFMHNATPSLTYVRILAIAIPIALGVLFFFKKSKHKSLPTQKNYGFLKGVFLNLISVQVFLYWMVAITYLTKCCNLALNPLNIAVFGLGILIAKMGVLFLYAYFSAPILLKSDFLSRNINRVIGTVLIFSGLLQLIK
ncbi:MAG: hypothetical protein CVU09_11260 [Bacteroidetes bacterium HGW-Bacteroidetes-4]|jgi:threonine/homoserine/homoserine lactone efflux protein|nr:MAG: hypothetical protein CVU09_11260 [Bacteroidetes bacterium HGW-Bacteroidetes-4]